MSQSLTGIKIISLPLFISGKAFAPGFVFFLLAYVFKYFYLNALLFKI